MTSEVITQAAWWGENALEAALLYRAIRGHFFRKYPVFYSYLSYVFLYSLISFWVHTFRPAFYPKFYWSLELVSVTVGYCVIWEIFRQVFGPYPGAARMTSKLLTAILVLIFCRVFLNALRSAHLWSPAHNAADLEKYLRVVQAALLISIVGLAAYYAIPLGKNAKGLILGYGIFVGLSVMQLAVGSYWGDSLQGIWKHLAWVSYASALITWSYALWSYAPSPSMYSDTSPEQDYERIASSTNRLILQIRDNLSRVSKP